MSTFLPFSYLAFLLITPLCGGSFDPAAGLPGSKAIALDDPRICGWAEEVHHYQPGEDLDAQWQNVEHALGPASGDPLRIVGLGRGGSLTFSWENPLPNGPGPDFAVFENSFSDRFLELAHVEVSSDGIHWQRFPSLSESPGPVGSFGLMDPTHLFGLAGKYRAGFGTGFDFTDLPHDPQIDRNTIRFIRLLDLVGDGRDLDCLGRPIYDPFPTFGSAGFDLDGLAILGPPPLTILGWDLEGESILFHWSTIPGKSYQLEVADSIGSGIWEETAILTATQHRITHREPISRRAFFRLREREENRE